MNRAVFFDRDDVLNVDTGFVCRAEDLVWTEGALDALRLASKRGYLNIVVTNQSGIARGLFSLEDLQGFMDRMEIEAEQAGGRIHAWYYCPHAPDDGCDCRKPQPGMLLRAALEHDLDLGKCLLIGDRETDIQAAEAAGVRGLLFAGGNLCDFLQEALDGLPS